MTVCGLFNVLLFHNSTCNGSVSDWQRVKINSVCGYLSIKMKDWLLYVKSPAYLYSCLQILYNITGIWYFQMYVRGPIISPDIFNLQKWIKMWQKHIHVFFLSTFGSSISHNALQQPTVGGCKTSSNEKMSSTFKHERFLLCSLQNC